jgi:ketosteroid isomerase-like protein
VPASLELVKIALQAYANGDCEIALALAGPHIRWDERASRLDGDLVWGHDNVQRAMRRYLDTWDEYRFDLEDVAEVAPGKVVGICRERGRPKEGPPIDRRVGGLWIVEDGKIVSWATYPTPREAVRAAKELAGPQVRRTVPKSATPPAPVVSAGPAQAPLAVPQPLAPELSEPEPQPDPEPEPEPEREPAQVDSPDPVEAEETKPFDFEEPDPAPAPAPVTDRPRKRILTKSEEQKRGARARAKLRKRSSRQSA